MEFQLFDVDLPGAEGKVPLGFDYVGGLTARGWRLTTPTAIRGIAPILAHKEIR